jgi:hypothetical protein
MRSNHATFLAEKRRNMLRTKSGTLYDLPFSARKEVCFDLLDQWFPTTVPRNTSVPWAGPKCSAESSFYCSRAILIAILTQNSLVS